MSKQHKQTKKNSDKKEWKRTRKNDRRAKQKRVKFETEGWG